VAGSAAFQAASIAEALIRGYRIAPRRSVPAEVGKMPALPGSLGRGG